MKTLANIISEGNINITALERKVLSCLNDELSGYMGAEDFSEIECKDISQSISVDVKSVKGVIGSLVKKGILTTYSSGNRNEYELILFVGQLDMEHAEFPAEEVKSDESIMTSITDDLLKPFLEAKKKLEDRKITLEGGVKAEGECIIKPNLSLEYRMESAKRIDLMTKEIERIETALKG